MHDNKGLGTVSPKAIETLFRQSFPGGRPFDVGVLGALTTTPSLVEQRTADACARGRVGIDLRGYVDAVRAGDINVVALSALLTTTMPNMKTTIEALKTAGLRDKVKVMVGGAPLTDQYAHEIGADGYAADASRAVALARSLLQ